MMDNQTSMEKNRIRKRALELRNQISSDKVLERSKVISKKLFTFEKYKDAMCILIYVSMKSEVRTDEIILDALKRGKRVFCPKCTDKANGIMEFVEIKDLGDLKEGYFGIREPEIVEDSVIFGKDIEKDSQEEMTLIAKSLVVVPGVAFDKNGNRIGYNGGYYDRFLSKYSGINTVALAFDEQIFDEIPTDTYDIPVNQVITG